MMPLLVPCKKTLNDKLWEARYNTMLSYTHYTGSKTVSYAFSDYNNKPFIMPRQTDGGKTEN